MTAVQQPQYPSSYESSDWADNERPDAESLREEKKRKERNRLGRAESLSRRAKRRKDAGRPAKKNAKWYPKKPAGTNKSQSKDKK